MCLLNEIRHRHCSNFAPPEPSRTPTTEGHHQIRHSLSPKQAKFALEHFDCHTLAASQAPGRKSIDSSNFYFLSSSKFQGGSSNSSSLSRVFVFANDSLSLLLSEKIRTKFDLQRSIWNANFCDLSVLPLVLHRSEPWSFCFHPEFQALKRFRSRSVRLPSACALGTRSSRQGTFSCERQLLSRTLGALLTSLMPDSGLHRTSAS